MLTRLTPLDGEAIIPLADAKAQARVKHSIEDDLISFMRDAAVGHVERESGIALAPAEFRWTLRRFPARIDLPMGPVTALGSVTYKDADGANQAYSDARLIGDIVLPAAGAVWPMAYDQVTVDFTAGLTSPDDAPELIMAAKLLLGHLYKNREAVVLGASEPRELPLGVAALIDTYRQVRV